jgi:hypothetical protein
LGVSNEAHAQGCDDPRARGAHDLRAVTYGGKDALANRISIRATTAPSRKILTGDKPNEIDKGDGFTVESRAAGILVPARAPAERVLADVRLGVAGSGSA